MICTFIKIIIYIIIVILYRIFYVLIYHIIYIKKLNINYILSFLNNNNYLDFNGIQINKLILFKIWYNVFTKYIIIYNINLILY